MQRIPPGTRMNADRNKKSATISVLPKAISDNQRSISDLNADATDASQSRMNADRNKNSATISVLPKAISDNQRSFSD